MSIAKDRENFGLLTSDFRRKADLLIDTAWWAILAQYRGFGRTEPEAQAGSRATSGDHQADLGST